jgi:hypothetical protein
MDSENLSPGAQSAGIAAVHARQKARGMRRGGDVVGAGETLADPFVATVSAWGGTIGAGGGGGGGQFTLPRHSSMSAGTERDERSHSQLCGAASEAGGALLRGGGDGVGGSASAASFRFQERRGRLDMRAISRLDIDSIVSSVDVGTLQAHLANLTFGRLAREDLVAFTDDNVVKLFQLSQLTIEYMMNVQARLHAHCNALEDQCKVSERGRLAGARGWARGGGGAGGAYTHLTHRTRARSGWRWRRMSVLRGWIRRAARSSRCATRCGRRRRSSVRTRRSCCSPRRTRRRASRRAARASPRSPAPSAPRCLGAMSSSRRIPHARMAVTGGCARPALAWRATTSGKRS